MSCEFLDEYSSWYTGNCHANYIERGETLSKYSQTHHAILPASPARIRSNSSIIDTVDPARRVIALVRLAAERDRVWQAVEEAEERGDDRIAAILRRRHLRHHEDIAGIIRRPSLASGCASSLTWACRSARSP